MTLEQFAKFLNENGNCQFKRDEGADHFYRKGKDLPENLSTGLFVPYKQHVGVSFYSSVGLHEYSKLYGPWLGTKLLDFFGKKDATVSVYVTKRSSTKPDPKSPPDEGKVVVVEVPDIDFNESTVNDERIQRFGEEILEFIEDALVDDQSAKRARLEYYATNRLFVENYANRRRESGEGLSDDELKNKEIQEKDAMEDVKKNQWSDLYWLVASYKEWGRYVKDMPVNGDQSYSVKDKKGKNKKYFPGIQDGDLVVAYQKAEGKTEPGVSTQAIVSILQCARDLNGETVKFKKVRDLKNPIRIDFTKIKKDKDNPLSRSEVIQMNCNGSLYRLTEAEADAVMKMINDSEGENVFAQSNGVNKEVKSLLESNLQVILTGAPGTGKTYTAREVAKEIVRAEDQEEGAKKAEEDRIASVQFHPGYDYSDFVIGMKPVLICGGKEVFRDAHGLYTKKDESKEEYDKENIEHRLAKDSETKVSFRWRDGIFKKFADKAKGDLDNKYVFLIDEINRADLSRVFGELFSLLEEEYRYPNGKGSDFILLPNGERFSIPKNLYIIGTMNDIDRSVESMDFALRRRFAWYEVTAASSRHIIRKKVKNVDESVLNKLEAAMDALNGMIAPKPKKSKAENGDVPQEQTSEESIDLRLGSEYQLGGAIFAKFEKYQKDGDDAFRKLWHNHIENILKEYLRGRSDRDGQNGVMNKLKNAYGKAVGVTVDSE